MIGSSSSILVPLDGPGRVGEARRIAHRLGTEAGLGESHLGRVGIVVTEAATNLAKHAREGALLLRGAATPEPGIEVISFDRGPGMADVDRCLVDGFSTGGTAGTGLGAIRRLADGFEIYSQPGRGTVLAVRIGLRPATEGCRVGVISVSAKGENRCGDAWSVQRSVERIRALVVDGLGHGPLAAEAAATAQRIFEAGTGLSLGELVRTQHQAMRSTRGAALAVAEILPEGKLRYAGVGNISGFLLDGGASRGLMSHAGIVGHELSRVSEIEYPWPPRGCLVLHSDGLSAKWNLAAYPGLLAQHPSIIAATLFRDQARGRDDATVLVLSPS